MGMKRYELNDAQWSRIAPLLPGKASDPGRTGSELLEIVPMTCSPDCYRSEVESGSFMVVGRRSRRGSSRPVSSVA